MHRQLGLALVPWMLAGGVAAIVVNHSRGFAAPWDLELQRAANDAEPAARRAWGHLLAKASLAGERVDLVADSAEWSADAPAPAVAATSRPSWASAERLEGFALPESDRPSDAGAHLVFLIRGDERLWRCTVELDGRLRVDAAADGEAPADEALHGSIAPEADGPWAALVDLVAAAMLAWGLSGCVVLWRNPSERRSGLFALATGAGVLAAFVTTI